MNQAGATEAARSDAGMSLTRRLFGMLVLVFVAVSAAFALFTRSVIQHGLEHQQRDTGSHFEARIRALDQGWRQSAFSVRQQAELWQVDVERLPEVVAEARLRALMTTLLDQGEFTHAAIVGDAGQVLFRYGTRSQDLLALPADSDAAGLGWVYSDRDRTVYRTVTGPVRQAGRPAQLLLYVPLDNALLAQLAYPNTQLDLLHEGQKVATSDAGALMSGPRASAVSADQRTNLSLRWDAWPGAPMLRIDRQFVTPISGLELLLIAGTCTGAYLVLGWWILIRWVRSQAQRLAQLRQAATEFAATPVMSSDLTVRLSAVADRGDDVGTLALTLGDMMGRIEQGQREQARVQQQLAVVNAGLEDRVAERTRELEQARDEALAAARAKEQFLANMSHEIRTPMNGMLGALDLLSHTALNPRQAQYIDVAATSGEALLGILNEVLDFAKIGAGGLQLAREPIDVNAVARSVTTLFSASAQRKSIELRLESDPALDGWRYGDSLRLRQVLLNLVGNAIKFTQRGCIVVGTHCVGSGVSEQVAFEVSDTGIGIDKTQHDRIFEPFVQAQDPARPAQGGTGLGLAISRDLVRAMGGELVVDSLPGKGTVFSFALPLQRAPGPAAAPAPAPPTAVAPEPRDERRPASLSGRVLLVEDNSVNRMVGTAMLESMGLDVVVAEDGEEALAVLAQTKVALVLMDCQMPVMDGYEATHRLRERERLSCAPRLPVIALTANALSGDIERCLAAGMDAHLAKPFMISQLHALIEHWMAAARAEEVVPGG